MREKEITSCEMLKRGENSMWDMATDSLQKTLEREVVSEGE